MDDIASISRGASSSLIYDIHHIVISVLRLIGDDHCIAAHDKEASMSRRHLCHMDHPSNLIRLPLRASE